LGNLTHRNGADFSAQLLEKARVDSATVLKELASQLNGLSQAEAEARVKQVGLNEIAREKHQSALLPQTLIIHVIRTNKIPRESLAYQ
jgi:Mg2+-importing ATPase